MSTMIVERSWMKITFKVSICPRLYRNTFVLPSSIIGHALPHHRSRSPGSRAVVNANAIP